MIYYALRNLIINDRVQMKMWDLPVLSPNSFEVSPFLATAAATASWHHIDNVEHSLYKHVYM